MGKDIGIIVKDGDPVIDVMIELDNSRHLDNIKNCSSCSDVGGSSEPGMGSVSNQINVSIPVNDSKELGKNGYSDPILVDQEEEWPKLGARKKNRKKIK